MTLTEVGIKGATMWPVLVLILSSKCVASMSPEIVDLVTPMRQIGEACGYESCPSPRPGVLNVHLVPHTHYELGYTRNFHEHYSGTRREMSTANINMKRTLDSVVTELWAHRHRKFTLSDFPYFFQWWSKRDPAVRRMVYELLRQGRLQFVGGGWSMSDEASTSYHAIIESFTYSLRKLNATFLECGRPLVAWQADVMGHSREFASLTALMGLDGLFISPISYDDELVRMRRRALELLWRGSDDLGPVSDIYTHKLFDGFRAPPGFCFSRECTDPLIVTSDNTFNNAAERGLAFIDSMVQRQAPNYNTSHVLVVMGRLLGYHDASTWFASIDKLIAEVNSLAVSKGRQMYLTYSTPACYLKAVHEANPPLETKQDDFLPMAYDKNSYVTGYYSSHPPLKLMAREGLVYLQMAKQMQVLARLFDNSQTFEAFNWILGAFQDHMVIAGVMKDHVRSYYVHKMYVAVQKSTLLLKQAWNKLRNCPKGTIYYRCSFNISSCHNARGRQTFIMVYNPLAWPVSLPIRLPVSPRGDTRVYLPNGDQAKTALLKIAQPILNIKYRITNMATHELVFIAENIPPLGFRSYFIEKVTATRKKRTLIKNMKRKNNKKYLIRQISPTIEEQALLNDLADYEYSEETVPFDGKNDTKTDETDKPKALTQITDDMIKEFEALPIKIVNKSINKTDIPKLRDVRTENHLNMLDEAKKQLWMQYESKTKKKSNLRMMSSTDTIDVVISDDDRIKLDDDDDETTTVKDDDVSIAEEVEEDTTASSTTVISSTDKATTSSIKPNNSADTNLIFSTKTSKPTEEAVLTVSEDINTTTESVTEDGNLKIEENEGQNETEENIEGRRSMPENSMLAGDMFIENKYIRINLDPSSHKIADVTLSNGLHINLDIQFYFYIADDPAKLDKFDVIQPGPYLFRPLDSSPVPVLDYLNTKVYKTRVVEEVHCAYADWASVVVRLYADSAVIEVDWLIGPVPLTDNLGKEIFIRYTTDLVNEGVFHTDSNGRQTIKRIRNLRPMYESLNHDTVAGNFYPVTSKIYIEDLNRNLRFAVFNDRAQGGTSLYDGEIDLLIQRRGLTDDTGIGAPLNDTEFGEGVIVRGKHYLYLSKADYKPNKIFEKKFAKELELQPQVLVSQPDPYGNQSKSLWLEHNNELSFLNNKLPVGIHILTLEEWNEGTLLLRLENYLERFDIRSNGVKRVFIRELFTNLVIKTAKETTLAANIWLDEFKQKRWTKKEDFVKNFNEFYGGKKDAMFLNKEVYNRDDLFGRVDLDRGISLAPQQIRTFVCTYDYLT